MNRNSFGRLCVSTALTALGTIAMPALAGEATKTSDQSAESTEIIVTARFKSESVQSAPLAITAISGKGLEERNIASVSSLGASIPNAFIAPPTAATGAAALISMRGIYQSDFNYAFEPGVGIYIDDVYHATLTGADMDLMDLDRVEVLRGPQGTLFGKNSMGGAIRLFSKEPNDDSSGYVEGGMGNLGRYELKAGFNTPLVKDKLFLRVSGATNHVNGYVNIVDFGCRMVARGTPGLIPSGITAKTGLGSDCKVGSEGGSDMKAGRVMLRWVASPQLDVNFSADYMRDDRESNPDVLIGTVPASALPPMIPSVAPWNGSLANGPTPVYDSRFVPSSNYETYANITTGNTASIREWGVSLTPVYQMSDKVKAKLIMGYRKFYSNFSYNPDASPYGFGENSNPTNHDQFSTELQITGSALNDKLDWTLGGYYFRGNTHLGGHIIYTFLVFDQDDKFGDKSESAFAHGIYHFNDALSLAAGLRYSHVTKDYTFHHPGITAQSFTNSVSENHTDWVVNLNYKASSDVSFYVQAATGFRPGGINPRPIVVPDQLVGFRGEKLISYEGGIKSQFLDRRVTFNLAGFYSDYKSHLSQSTIFECLDTGLPSFSGPAGCSNPALSAPWFYYFNDKAEIYGIEAEFSARPTDHLSLNASLGWNHARSLVKNPAAPNYRDPSNLFQPEWNLSAGIQYAFELPSAATITPRLDWNYQSKMTYNGNLAAPVPALLVAPGYNVVNGRLAFASPDRSWELVASVTNLFNQFYWYNKFALNGFAYSGVPSRPREWKVTVRKTF